MANTTVMPVDKRHEPKDKFSDLIQGPAVEVIVGTKTTTSAPPTYHLPRTLLSTQSVYFKEEIDKLTSTIKTPDGEDRSTPPTSPSPDPASPTSNPHASSYTPQIHLPDVDPPIFSLFLKWIYQGSFPSHADPHFGPGSAQHSLNIQQQTCVIPPSVNAWLLGSFLQAPAFQNHALLHIYHSLGLHFGLTPSLVSYVWKKTSPGAQLRNLVLDVLVIYWSANTNHVAKFNALNGSWEEVFDAFPDLRREFIFGLQTRRVQAVHRYFMEMDVQSNSVLVPWTVVGGKKEGAGPVEKDAVPGHAQQVVIKQEGDEVPSRALAMLKASPTPSRYPLAQVSTPEASHTPAALSASNPGQAPAPLSKMPFSKSPYRLISPRESPVPGHPLQRKFNPKVPSKRSASPAATASNKLSHPPANRVQTARPRLTEISTEVHEVGASQGNGESNKKPDNVGPGAEKGKENTTTNAGN